MESESSISCWLAGRPADGIFKRISESVVSLLFHRWPTWKSAPSLQSALQPSRSGHVGVELQFAGLLVFRRSSRERQFEPDGSEALNGREQANA